MCKEVGCKMKDCVNDHSILEFVSSGPENYAFKTDTGLEVCKVNLINFISMRELLKDGV